MHQPEGLGGDLVSVWAERRRCARVCGGSDGARHLYLGTVNGWLYESHDGGESWKRLARMENRTDLALDNIVVDPADAKHLLVGAWILGQDGGGLFESHDAGHTWTSDAEMKGQSIRALAMAPSDPKILVAGTLQGVFRSTDRGAHWTQISPEGSKEIHEVESIAIDPVNPQVIYAGTWHLPWKTTDGGEHWDNMKQGIIDDSDVFSIIVDPKQPQVVYASACSGIYKSEDAGGKFKKVAGDSFDGAAHAGADAGSEAPGRRCMRERRRVCSARTMRGRTGCGRRART